MFARHLANSPMVLKRKTTIGQAAKVDERQSQHLSEARSPPLTPPQRPEKALWLGVSLFGGGSMSELAVAREGAQRSRALLKKNHRQKPRKHNRGVPPNLRPRCAARHRVSVNAKQRPCRSSSHGRGPFPDPARRLPQHPGVAAERRRKSGAIDCGEQSAHERPCSWRAQRCRI
jgi:hypothetical protein